MPYIFDFNKCINGVKTIDVNPKGWRGPLTIEYGVAQNSKYDTQVSVVWRIKGTSHTFTIYERRLNVISHANYKKHFEEALEGFREDYLSWFKDKEYDGVDWKYEYKSQYGDLIISEECENN
jgi:hypothetical protein